MIIAIFVFESCKQERKPESKDNAVIVQQESDPLTAQSVPTKYDYLKNLNGVYPCDVQLFVDSSLLMHRLKKLLGKKAYHSFKEIWGVEAPMEFVNNTFSASACMKHNCANTNFIIVLDFSKDVLYACIRIDRNPIIYSEDGSGSDVVDHWIINK